VTPRVLLVLVVLLGLSAPTFAAAQDDPLLRAKLPGPSGTAVEFSRDGKLILTAGGDEARVWDARTYEPATPAMKHAAPVRAVSVSADGARLAAAAGAEAIVWDARIGRRLFALPHPSRVIDAAISPDARTVATACLDGSARLWDGTTGAPLRTLKHEHPVRSVSFSPDGTRLLTGSVDPEVEPRATEDERGPVDANNPYAPGLAHVWDTAQRKELCSFPLNFAWCRGRPEFSPDGRRVALPAGRGGAILCDVDAWEHAAQWVPYQGVFGVRRVRFAGKGDRVLVSGDDGAHVDVVPDERVGVPGYELPYRFEQVREVPGCDAAAMSLDGKLVAAVFAERGLVPFDEPALIVLEASSGREVLKVMRGSDRPVHPGRTLAFSPDGGHVAAGFASDGFTAVYQVEDPDKGK
jgi:WD40 repeat protein